MAGAIGGAGPMVVALVFGLLATITTPVAGTAAPGGTAATAQQPRVSRDLRFTASDGVELRATLTGVAPLEPRPVIVELSPYGRDSGTLDPGPAYNFLLVVQIRGTGDSHGRFDALGPRSQRDVAEVLGSACEQPWSTGELGLNGFSASAIVIYNSLHLELPCVTGAVLRSGTFDLYRDLIYPGGIRNLVPSAAVLLLIGGSTLVQAPAHLGDPPSAWVDVLAGQLGTAVNGLWHATLDAWWRARGFRGDVNRFPILMIGGFFDVESRGAFQAFQELRDTGAHLMVIGAHDGVPAGTDGGLGTARAWLDRWVRGERNGVEDEPAVQLWVADGGYEALLAGRYVRVDGEDWPLPGTEWLPLALDSRRSGSSLSLNDGRLTAGPPGPRARWPYLAAASLPTATDPYNVSNLGPAAAPFWDARLAEPLGLSWTTAPFEHDVVSVGPATLELRLASTAPETAIWVTLSDVAPDGTATPVAAGRLLSSYPRVDEARSLRDPATGDIVQPYGIYGGKAPATIGAERLHRVEIWPIGNRFKAGHRLRVHVSGSSAAYGLSLPAINTVAVGEGASRLLLPVVDPRS